MRQVVSHYTMARRRRHRKPLLPGLWTVLAAFALVGSIGGFYWVLGRGTRIVRNDAPPVPAVAKRK
jgi:H+/Cl- antiporter ClcA